MEVIGSRPNLVLGLAEGLDWAALRPFVESLAQTCFDGELHLFVAGVDDGTRRMLRGHGVQLHSHRRLRFRINGRVFHAYDPPLRRFHSEHITSLYPGAIRALSVGRQGGGARLAAAISVPYVARYFRYHRFLTDAASRYENVMLTDVRDVFFQHDPFDFEIGSNVHCFLEDDRHTLGSEKFDRGWILTAYGNETLAEIGEKPISCSGITIGSSDAIAGYVRVMVSELLGLRDQYAGIDQGVHNYVVYKGLVPHARLVRNGDGAVFTVGLVPHGEIDAAIDAGHLEHNVIHQYPHYARLKERLLAKLA